jgi:hypothetical protein
MATMGRYWLERDHPAMSALMTQQERTRYAQIYAVQQIRVNVCVIISVLGTEGAEHCDH